ncbi:AI-2E family transporter [Halococcus sp. AFM35]|uniref:AI-2E family transporter n=1 Tax=Halococcus sp. AFM35 TaxID=3421653 RepID=UPI003EB79BE7
MVSLLSDYDRSRIPVWFMAVVFGLALSFIVWRYVGTFVLGLFVYYITRPIHRRLADHVPTSSLAAAVSLLTVALPVILLIGYTVYVGVFQLADVAESANLQPVLDALEPYIGGAGVGTNPQAIFTAAIENPQEFLSGGVVDALSEAAAPAAGYLSALGNALIHLFVVLALAFYLLRDDHKLAAWFRSQLAGSETPMYAYLDAVDRNLKTIYFGNILNAFSTAILAAISYNVLNAVSPAGVAVPSPTLLGLLTGVGSLVPVIGMKIVYVPVALLLAVEAALANPALLWFPVVFAVVSLVIVDTIPDLVLRPYVSGRDLHTGSVMIAYIVGPLLFGWYGLFLGPLLLVLFVHFARILLPELVRGEPLTTRATAGNPLDPTDDIPVPEPEPVDLADDATTDENDRSEPTDDGSRRSSGEGFDTDD